MTDRNTAALRIYQNDMDKRDRGAAALYDAADYLANEEIDALFIDPDKLGTAVFEYDIDIWKPLVRALEQLEAASSDPRARVQALEALREIRSTIHRSLYMPALRRCEEKLAEEADHG